MPIDTAGNTLLTARELIASPGLQTIAERVDLLDSDDYYRFNVTHRSSFNLVLNGLSANAELQLLNSSGSAIQSSTNTGSITESISTILETGAYYIRVHPGSGGAETDYILNLTFQTNRQADITWRDYGSGVGMVWNMGGNTPLSAWNLPTGPANFRVEAIADFNQDNHPDILWRNSSTGMNTVWFMGGVNHASLISSAFLPFVPQNWSIEGVADFNGDRHPDILWRDHGTGTNTVWFMGGSNGTTMSSWRYLPSVEGPWAIRGIADFNGDQRPDIVWRNATTGTNTVWFMGGTGNTLVSSWSFLPGVATSWNLEGVADLNNDDRPDLIWRDYATGTNTAWFMGGVNGTSLTTWSFLPQLAPNWQAIAYNRFETPNPIDLAGNTIATALNIGNLNGTGTFSDRIDDSDPNDCYRFHLTTTSTFSLTLNGLSGNTDLQLLNQQGALVLTANNSGTTAEAVNTQLAAGTYYIRVYPTLGVTSPYNLTVAATPAPIDLSGVFFDVPEPLTAGNTLNASFRIQNTGTGTANNFRVSFYLSSDNTITTSDRLLNSVDFSSLAANTPTATLTTTLALPGLTDTFWNGTRTYYIGMVIDPLNGVSESNETNNANRGNGIDWDDVAVTVPVTAPTVGTVTPTGNLAIDALLAASPYNYYWNTSGNGGIITYSFLGAAGAASYYGSEIVSEVSDAIKANIRNILARLESFINVRFIEVTDTGTSYGVLRYMFSNGPDYAYAYYPSTNPIGGDVHLTQAYESDPSGQFSGGNGSYGYETLIHETFHALGLKHPGNYNGSGTGEGPFLASGDDNNTNTVMSYNFAGTGAITPMSYDIRALQYIYGVSGGNASNNTYAFSTVYGYNNDGQFFGSNTTP